MNIPKKTSYTKLWESDFDKDGIPNIDDTKPFDKKIKRHVNKEVSLSEKWNGLKNREKSYRKDIKELSEKIGTKKGRVKKSYSTIGKQMGRYIENIKDMGGLRVLTNNKKENNQVLNHIEKTFKKCKKDTDNNCIFEIENKYTNKSKVFKVKQTKRDELPYLGYHVGLKYKGKPYEVQIKCKSMQKIQDKTHPYYKSGKTEFVKQKFGPQVLRLKKGGC
jgi:(p)ppGpp synthase/HD superfamily hydrolase